jgi:hypothetical protein
MRWRQARRSSNVEDRRGASFGRRPLALGGGAGLLVLLAAIFLGADPRQLLLLLGGDEQMASLPGESGLEMAPSAGGPPPGDEQADFVSAVLGDTEDAWSAIFARLGRQYEPPPLVLFTDQIPSACGFGEAAMGPFYCPGDRKVYLDLSFFDELGTRFGVHQRFGAPGDFAQAYVIAHEVGHHVQNLLGISGKVSRMQQAAGRAEANALSVRLELQADCLAGVWGHHAATQRDLLEEGDVEEGLRAAAAIGDDRIQRLSTGRVHPESWTHGSSEQRAQWFRRGLESGDLAACDSFAEPI